MEIRGGTEAGLVADEGRTGHLLRTARPPGSGNTARNPARVCTIPRETADPARTRTVSLDRPRVADNLWLDPDMTGRWPGPNDKRG